VLQSLGLGAPSDFAVVLGQSAFYAGYLRHMAPDAATAVTSALAAKDLVTVDAIAGELPAATAGVRGIPRIVGPATDGSLIEEAERFAVGEEAKEALENLREIMRHLEAHGALGAVILDLGLSGRHDYYTGAVYEAYAAGLGFTVANGGRYDNLLRRFGKELPATGFAIYLERLLSVLPEEGPSAATSAASRPRRGCGLLACPCCISQRSFRPRPRWSTRGASRQPGSPTRHKEASSSPPPTLPESSSS
jgi:ATP phosphoribosyltransferase regulatory subunit